MARKKKGLLSKLLPKKRKTRRGTSKKTAGRKPQARKGTAAGKMTTRRKPARKQHGWFYRFFWKTALYGSIAGTLVLAGFILTLPSIDELYDFKHKPAIVLHSESGEVIGSFGDVYGDFLTYEELPKSLVDAVLATEDRNFFYHIGIDPMGLARATYANIEAGKVVQGGSTITQQVAKNVFLTPERSFLRKFREMLLAFKLELRFTKKQIMSIYLNRMYLGSGHYGVDAASRRYFNKSARQISLPESAILAGLLKAPSRYSPTANPELSRKRASQVLVNMQDAGFLSEKQLEKSLATLKEFEVKQPHTAQSNLYFADWIIDQIPELVSGVEEDLVVVTTLNTKWQQMGQDAINKIMDEKSEEYKAGQAALVAIDNKGAVRVMIGGRNYAKSQYNRAYQAMRQPGSSFKLFVYLAGLEAGFTPELMMEDGPLTIAVPGKDWSPKNYDHRYRGLTTIRQGVKQSINTIAVQVSESAGRGKVVDMAQRLGITAKMDAVPSIALGATEVSLFEMTGAYAHMAAGGNIIKPYGIISITTSSGKPIYKRTAPPEGKTLSANVVGMMNDMLMDVIAGGTGARAAIGRPAAGKTGTTSDYRDAWFLGYTPQLAAGVWVGNDDNSPMKRVTGGTLPAPIWKAFMQEALKESKALALPVSQAPESLPWQEQRGGVSLGSSFWDKLMGDNPPPRPQPNSQIQRKQERIEYQYPYDRRN